MNPQNFYKDYLADDCYSALSAQLVAEILKFKPQHALDFGCGSGKHSASLLRHGVEPIAIDLSMMNVIRANVLYNLPMVICAGERVLKNIDYVDVVFTCSVLDHIPDITDIVADFKRIANKAIVIAETTYHNPAKFYYGHDYQSFGFKPTSFSWKSDPATGDGNTYNIWVCADLRG